MNEGHHACAITIERIMHAARIANTAITCMRWKVYSDVYIKSC